MTRFRTHDDAAYEVEHISRQIQPLLKDRGPEVQGGVLADLVSLWLAGHAPQLRKTIHDDFIKLVGKLVPESEKELFGDRGHPSKE